MGALQFVDIPSYSAILFRRTYADLSLPGALMDRANEWLVNTAARYEDKAKTWRFPSGATLTFGYLDAENDRFRYQSSEYSFVGFDELTQFKERDYLYLFSRLRRSAGSNIPLRMRSATNPGGIGHAWVKSRFGIGKDTPTGRLFVSARLSDNPHLDQAEYTAALENLDSVTRRQLLTGDWSDYKGLHFRPDDWPRWIDIGDAVRCPEVFRKDTLTTFATVDWATSEKKTSDFTCIGVFALTPDNRILILDVHNKRLRLEDCVPYLARVCAQWKPTLVAVEASGFQLALALECRRFPSIPEPRHLKPGQVTKLRRALPAVVMGENRRILLPSDALPWIDDLTAQLASFTGEKDEHDDMVDVLAYAAILANQLRVTGYQGDGPLVLAPGKEYRSPSQNEQDAFGIWGVL